MQLNHRKFKSKEKNNDLDAITLQKKLGLIAEDGCNPFSQDELSKQLLHAAYSDNVQQLQKLIEAGADINTTTRNGLTPFMIAASNGNLDIVKYLIQQDVDTKAKSPNGSNAFLIAAKNGHLEIVEHFIKQGTDVNTTSSADETTLMIAAKNGHLKNCQLLNRTRRRS